MPGSEPADELPLGRIQAQLDGHQRPGDLSAFRIIKLEHRLRDSGAEVYVGVFRPRSGLQVADANAAAGAQVVHPLIILGLDLCGGQPPGGGELLEGKIGLEADLRGIDRLETQLVRGRIGREGVIPGGHVPVRLGADDPPH